MLFSTILAGTAISPAQLYLLNKTKMKIQFPRMYIPKLFHSEAIRVKKNPGIFGFKDIQINWITWCLIFTYGWNISLIFLRYLVAVERPLDLDQPFRKARTLVHYTKMYSFKPVFWKYMSCPYPYGVQINPMGVSMLWFQEIPCFCLWIVYKRQNTGSDVCWYLEVRKVTIGFSREFSFYNFNFCHFKTIL